MEYVVLLIEPIRRHTIPAIILSKCHVILGSAISLDPDEFIGMCKAAPEQVDLLSLEVGVLTT